MQVTPISDLDAASYFSPWVKRLCLRINHCVVFQAAAAT